MLNPLPFLLLGIAPRNVCISLLPFVEQPLPPFSARAHHHHIPRHYTLNIATCLGSPPWHPFASAAEFTALSSVLCSISVRILMIVFSRLYYNFLYMYLFLLEGRMGLNHLWVLAPIIVPYWWQIISKCLLSTRMNRDLNHDDIIIYKDNDLWELEAGKSSTF